MGNLKQNKFREYDVVDSFIMFVTADVDCTAGYIA
jgi:hypothetical protein